MRARAERPRRGTGGAPLIRQALAAVVAGVLAFAAAAIGAVVLLLVVAAAGAGLSYVGVASHDRLARLLVIVAAVFVVGVPLWVLFDTAATVAVWLRAPRWFGVGVAGVFGGAALHWLLLSLTWVNWAVFDVTFPYWWRHFEKIQFG